jgi:hypothetical protein
MIIGLSGYAQSGKDTVAKTLIEKHGFERRAFADPIRNILYDLDVHGIKDIVDTVGWDGSKKIQGIRMLLQNLGVAARTYISEDVWVQAALNNLEKDKHYVITDVRFPNEAHAIKMLGGLVCRVQRPGIGPVNKHISETALDGYQFDKIINNGTGLDGLESQVLALVNDI